MQTVSLAWIPIGYFIIPLLLSGSRSTHASKICVPKAVKIKCLLLYWQLCGYLGVDICCTCSDIRILGNSLVDSSNANVMYKGWKACDAKTLQTLLYLSEWHIVKLVMHSLHLKRWHSFASHVFVLLMDFESSQVVS